jgi:hypothetical protein
MSRRLGGLLSLTLGFATIGAAASVALASDSLGAAQVASGRCATGALSVIQTLTGTAVSSVSVGVLPAACGGATLRVAVHNGLTSSQGSATIPGGGGTVSVTLAIAVPVTVAEQTDVVVSGP